MDEIEPIDPEAGTDERHPADTLNEGSALKFVFWVPALLLHTAIAALAMPILCGLIVRLWMLPSFLLRSVWMTAVIYYVITLGIGLAWSRRLDRWLFGTSRWVWILPTAWLVFRMIGTLPLSNALAMLWQTVAGFILVMLPFVCASGYTVGAWIRRSTGEEIPEMVSTAIGDRAEKISAEQLWSRAVKLWRAGRSVDYPNDTVKADVETADSSLRSE